MKPKTFLSEAVKVLDRYEREKARDQRTSSTAHDAIHLLMRLLPVEIRHTDADMRLKRAFSGEVDA